MRPRSGLIVWAFLLIHVGVSAAETAEPRAAVPALQKLIESAEAIDAELARLRGQLRTETTPAKTRQIKARIKELEERLEQHLVELERIVGAPPAPAASAPSLPFEQQSAGRERRQETILDTNAKPAREQQP